MQTFLAEPDYQHAAAVLDTKRLNSQLNECARIMTAIVRGTGWIHHPVTHQWRDNVNALGAYATFAHLEWLTRGHNTNKNWEVVLELNNEYDPDATANTDEPWWWTDAETQDRVIVTHRGNLYNKNPEHYAQYKAEADFLGRHPDLLVCCPGKHAPYYYPTHRS